MLVKKTLPFLMIFVSFACKDLGVEPNIQTEYYWSADKKVQVILNRATVIGIYKPNSAYPSRWLEVLYLDNPQTLPLRSIIAGRGLNPDDFEWLSFGYTYNGTEVIPTNRISFSLKEDYTVDDLRSIMWNSGVFDSTNFGTTVIRMLAQEGNVFTLANAIYESKMANYSTPDFVARITYP